MKKFTKVLAVSLIVVLSMMALVACAPNSDPAKARASLDEHEYTNSEAIDKIAAATLKLLVDGVDTVVSGSKVVEDKDGNKKMESVTIVYFYQASQAKDAMEDLKKESDKDKEDESDWVFEQSGKMIYWGTKEGVKAAR